LAAAVAHITQHLAGIVAVQVVVELVVGMLALAARELQDKDMQVEQVAIAELMALRAAVAVRAQ
jgi:hypothetical protein